MLSSREDILALLETIPDPEIPVISIVELGVVREVQLHNDAVEVTITPTYSGCPAMKQMEDDVRTTLSQAGFDNVKISMVYNPPWTTDWMSAEAKEKLRKYGIAPPAESSADKASITGKARHVPCPRCHSPHTTMVSQFGSTACKALFKCEDCLEAFDFFKCI